MQKIEVEGLHIDGHSPLCIAECIFVGAQVDEGSAWAALAQAMGGSTTAPTILSLAQHCYVQSSLLSLCSSGCAGAGKK